jgi:hypothetical protein
MELTLSRDTGDFEDEGNEYDCDVQAGLKSNDNRIRGETEASEL